MESLSVLAPAKINLSLDIKGIRNDGFHEVEMIMQTINLCDIIKIRKISKGIKLTTSDENLTEDSNNLAYQAAQIILKKSGLEQGVAIDLEKNIPIAAGLAGGSSDAAAVLRGINKLYKLNYPYTALVKLAESIGSDVPFCLQGGTALATGRGNHLTQLPDICSETLIIINPPVSVSTPEIYHKYDQFKPELEIPTTKLIHKIKNQEKLKWDQGWNNVLEKVTEKIIIDVKKIKKILKNEFKVNFQLMSGSGPTVFAIIKNKEEGDFIKNNWPRNQDQIFITKTQGQYEI